VRHALCVRDRIEHRETSGGSEGSGVQRAKHNGYGGFESAPWYLLTAPMYSFPVEIICSMSPEVKFQLDRLDLAA